MQPSAVSAETGSRTTAPLRTTFQLSHYLVATGKMNPFDAINPVDVAAMLALLKIARIASGHAKEDNWIDLAGYAACGGEIEAKIVEVSA